jgi:hypothetical protein
VIRGRLLDAQKRLRGGSVGAIRIARHAVPRDDRVALQVGVIDVEEAVFLVARMKGEAEEAALAAAGDAAGDVEEWIGEEAGAVPHADFAALLDDEEARVARMRDRNGLRGAGHDRLEDDVRLRLRKDRGQQDSEEVHEAVRHAKIGNVS